jgi:hypothetical protein
MMVLKKRPQKMRGASKRTEGAVPPMYFARTKRDAVTARLDLPPRSYMKDLLSEKETRRK